jgi:hypothetical protein
MALGRIERVEELIEILRINAHTRVTHRQSDAVRVQIGSQDYPAYLRLTRGEGKYLARCVVQVRSLSG